MVFAEGIPWPSDLPSPNGEVTRVVAMTQTQASWGITSRLELPGQGRIAICRPANGRSILYPLPSIQECADATGVDRIVPVAFLARLTHLLSHHLPFDYTFSSSYWEGYSLTFSHKPTFREWPCARSGRDGITPASGTTVPRGKGQGEAIHQIPRETTTKPKGRTGRQVSTRYWRRGRG